MGRRRRGPQGRAEDRVRGRVRGRTQGRSTGGRGDAARRKGTFDVEAVEGYANRLKDQLGGTKTQAGGSADLSGAAAGLAGAASGLAGGGLAHGLFGGGGEGSEEDLGNEVKERLDLMDERLSRLEEEMGRLLGGSPAEPPAEPGSETRT